ncbi:hypothetical protein ACFX19_003884 [Malus domestica]
MGDLGFCLGMEIQRISTTISLTQTHYAFDLLKKYSMKSCKPSPTPLSSSTRLSCLGGDSFSDPFAYRSMVGGLQYFTPSCPDIVGVLSLHCPTSGNSSSLQAFILV